MKVAWYFDAFPFGGAEKATLDIANALAAYYPEEIEPIVITRRLGRDISPVRSIVLPGADGIYTPQGREELIQALADNGIDIYIQAMDPPEGFLSELRQRLPSLKIIYHFHSMPFWHVVRECHNRRSRKIREFLLHKYTRRYTRRYRADYQASHCLVALCDAYTRQFRCLLGKRVVTMHNPLDPTPFAGCDAAPKRKEVIFVGRLSRMDKRLDRLMQVWSRVWPRHQDWTLKIVGSGEDEEPLRELARELNLHNVEFCGPTDNPAPYYATASILCLTSAYEGWGLVLVEALACNVRVLAMKCCGGVREVLRLSDSKGVGNGNVRRFASVLSRMMNTTEGTLTDHAVQFLDSLSPEATARKWARLLTALHDGSFSDSF